MKKARTITVTLGISLAILCLTGCSQKVSVRTVTIAYNPSAYASAVSQIMINENLLTKYLPDDVNVEWVEMSNASDIRDALVSGTLDIATPALSAFISAYENDMPIKLISNYGNAQVSLYGKNGINNIVDFTNNDIIAIKGLNSNPHIALLAYCKENGLDVSFYNSILNKIPEAETIGMLENNTDIAGAVLSYPTTKKADVLDTCKMLIDFSDVIKEYNLGTVVCSNSEFYDNNRDIIVAFETAHKYIVDNWEKNIDKNALFLSELYNCPVGEIEELMENLPPTMDISGYDKLANLMYECGMITDEPISFQNIMK